MLKLFPLWLLALLMGACGTGRKIEKSPQAASNVTNDKSNGTGNQLGISIPPGASPALVQEVERWMGVPYAYGGSTRAGTDCSGLICSIYPVVYQIKPPRGTAILHQQATPLRQPELREGDLVFFSIDTQKPGHSGIYLWDGYFVHASTSRGVMISNLNEPYWKKYFTGGGRLTQTADTPARK